MDTLFELIFRVPGSNTAADHLAVLDAAIGALPPTFRRRLMVTADGRGRQP